MPASFGRVPCRISVEEFRALNAGRRLSPRVAVKRRPLAAIDESPLPLTLTLPFLPPSVNKLFATVRDNRTGATIRVLTAHARRIRKLVCAMVRGRLNPDALYELSIDVYLNAFTRAGEMRQVDVSNRVKFLEDCLCHALGIDDRQFFRVVATKHHANSEQTVISICRFVEKREAA